MADHHGGIVASLAISEDAQLGVTWIVERDSHRFTWQSFLAKRARLA